MVTVKEHLWLYSACGKYSSAITVGLQGHVISVSPGFINGRCSKAGDSSVFSVVIYIYMYNPVPNQVAVSQITSELIKKYTHTRILLCFLFNFPCLHGWQEKTFVKSTINSCTSLKTQGTISLILSFSRERNRRGTGRGVLLVLIFPPHIKLKLHVHVHVHTLHMHTMCKVTSSYPLHAHTTKPTPLHLSASNLPR